jgi:hypothetical protein
VTDDELVFFRQGLIALAGKIAETRALRGSEPGWVKLISPEGSLAIHEAAHQIVAALCVSGEHHSQLGMEVQRWHIFCRWLLPTVSQPRPLILEPGTSVLILDRTHIAEAALALTLTHCPKDMPRWPVARRVIRLLRQAAAALIEEHWFLIIVPSAHIKREFWASRSKQSID